MYARCDGHIQTDRQTDLEAPASCAVAREGVEEEHRGLIQRRLECCPRLQTENNQRGMRLGKPLQQPQRHLGRECVSESVCVCVFMRE